jgi:hypothetical protein
MLGLSFSSLSQDCPTNEKLRYTLDYTILNTKIIPSWVPKVLLDLNMLLGSHYEHQLIMSYVIL